MDDAETLRPLLRKLVGGKALTEQEAYSAFEEVMLGRAGQAQIGALLTAMECRDGGPTVDEIVGAARAMRQHVVPVQPPEGVEAIDTCGTGGVHGASFNVSTTAAVIAAGAGAYVAKHGNRSVTSTSGSAQVLEHLGVKLDAPPPVQARCLAEAHICFCFAPAHHPAMKHAIGPRRELGFRTIFNLLGPLTNPAGARRQLMGVPSVELTDKIADALLRLGAVHALVVHGDNQDDITTTGPTRVCVVRDGAVTSQTWTADQFGLPAADIQALRADTVESSAAMVRQVLDGQTGPPRDIAALNAAAAIMVAGLADDVPQGLALAQQSIDSGAAGQALDKLVALSNAAD